MKTAQEYIQEARQEMIIRESKESVIITDIIWGKPGRKGQAFLGKTFQKLTTYYTDKLLTFNREATIENLKSVGFDDQTITKLEQIVNKAFNEAVDMAVKKFDLSSESVAKGNNLSFGNTKHIVFGQYVDEVYQFVGKTARAKIESEIDKQNIHLSK